MVKHMKAQLIRNSVLTGLLLLSVAGGIYMMTRHNGAPADGKVRVVASYYPLYEFASQVGGGAVQVTNMTPPGTEPHEYEPSPKALAEAQQAAMFVYNGGAMEPWVNGFLSDYQGTVVTASEHIGLRIAADDNSSSHQANDPHFWLDPVLAQQIVGNVRDGLIKADPAHAADYRARAAAYTVELQRLDNDFKQGLASCATRTIVTSHAAFGYLAARYNLQVMPIAGLTPDAEPSAAKLAELTQLMRTEGIHYVFFERLVSPRLADTIATETGARTLVFDPIEGLSSNDQAKGKGYVSIQRENLANLRTALACH